MRGRTNAGGAALNFKVVGGTTRPTNPKENTIWVNTDVEITNWIFHATQPAGVEGRVWIKTGISSSVVEFNALKKNGITVYPLAASQFIGGTWVEKDAQTYQSGAWSEWVTWLYNGGNQMTDLTGGWKASGIKSGSSWTATAPTIKQNADNMYTALSGGSGKDISGFTYTANKINLSDVNTIVFKGSTTKSGDHGPALVVTSSVSSTTALTMEAVKWNLVNGGTLDVSSLTGSYYVGFFLRGAWNYEGTACSVTCTELYCN